MPGLSLFKFNLYFMLFLTLFMPVLFLSGKASGLETEQKKVIQSGVPYFNVDDTPVSCRGSGTQVTGSNNGEIVYNYLTGKGLTPIQTAGFMGNLEEESPGFEPGVQEGKPTSGRGGYGIAQWTASRRVALEAAAAAKNVPVSDMAFQLDFLWAELENPDDRFLKSVLIPLRATSDLREATSIVLFNFEGPANAASKLDYRTKLALGFLTEYGSSTGAAMAPPNSISTNCNGTLGGGIVTSGYSLPVDEKFYIENKIWFTKDHHLGKGGSQNVAADIPVPDNSLVYSMTDGKIISAPTGGGLGQGVIIDAGNGVKFFYGHGKDGGSLPGAKQGDTVKAGQLIMHSGNTGFSKGSHLHLEIQINGQERCPQTLFVGIFEKNVPPINSLPATGCSSGEIIYR